MVLFLLYMKADLEGVASVTLRSDCNLCLTVSNPLSGDGVREKVVVDQSQFVEHQDDNGREPPHHFALKWEGAKKAATLTVLSSDEARTALKKKIKKKADLDGLVPAPYTCSGSYAAPILCVECRGMEPTAFFCIDSEFVVTSTGGATFGGGNSDKTDNKVDLSEGDWADYDAEHDAPVSVSEIEFKWEAV
jgi:Eukaryotic protein of unknown function (DUF866)